MKHPERREFLKALAVAGAAAAVGRDVLSADAPPASSFANALPRWRGFNLLGFFNAFGKGEFNQGKITEDDLRFIRDWGFDFIRLPMDYWFWLDTDWRKTRRLAPQDACKISLAALENVDKAVDLCRKYRLHVCLNFHRAPGYCVNERDTKREPFSLWRDKAAEDAFVHHWETFARRYKDVPAAEMSFNLVNEAPKPKDGVMTEQDYRRVMTRAAEAIRVVSPDRKILADGYAAGSKVAEVLVDTGLAQSVHAYTPGQISHYRAAWVDRKSDFPTPAWPLRKKDGSIDWDRKALEKLYAPWGELVRKGVGVHCGECGCYNKTPHEVFLGWMADVLDILRGHGIGYALWNLRGSFGVLDSGRSDVAYEDFHGHKLDRKLLDLLRKT